MNGFKQAANLSLFGRTSWLRRKRADRGLSLLKNLSSFRHKGNGKLVPPFFRRRGPVGKTPDKQIKEIEETQQALRESIEEAKSLAEKAQRLLQKHKKTIERQAD